MDIHSLLSQNSNYKNLNKLPKHQLHYVLEHLFGKSITEIIIDSQKLLSTKDKYNLFNVEEKLKIHTPVEYIYNEADFLGLTYYVNEDVLIPREKTENLVEIILNFISKYQDTIISNNMKLLIYDLCTGSGNIAITLAKRLSDMYIRSFEKGGGLQFKIIAVDISSKAIKIAKLNAKNLLTGKQFDRLEFLVSDIKDFQKFTKDVSLKARNINLIISNPPYIPTNNLKNIQNSVKNHEPQLALDGGISGIEHYATIAHIADVINADQVFCETNGKKQVQKLKSIYKSNKFHFI